MQKNLPSKNKQIEKSADKREIIKKLISLVLILFSFMWLGYLIYSDRKEISSIFSNFTFLNMLFFVLSLILGGISIFLTIFVFHRIINKNSDKYVPLVYLIKVFFKSQIVRYLPGRFFGIGYQIGETMGNISAFSVLKSNVEFMFLSLLVNTTVSVSTLLLFKVNFISFFFFTIFCFVVIFLYLKLNIFYTLVKNVIKFFPLKFKFFNKDIKNFKRFSLEDIFIIFMLYTVSWVFYFLAWYFFKYVFPNYHGENFILLCSIYTISWAIGFITMITPGGLGIREWCFVNLSSFLMDGFRNLPFFSVFFRIWLIIIDLLLFFISVPFAKILKNSLFDSPPFYDLNGLNILDPNDKLGLKSNYITTLQCKAIELYFPEGNGKKIAVDLGCGYGRLTPVILRKGWKTIGIDPCKNLIDFAEKNYPSPQYLVGSLPNLPLKERSVSLMVLFNLLRPLLLLGKLDVVNGIGNYITEDGWIIVVDNIRDGHPNYLPENEIVGLIEKEGFKLKNRIPIRASRWWVLYLIRYGLVPEKFFNSIAMYELKKMKNIKKRPKWQYYNVIFIFERK